MPADNENDKQTGAGSSLPAQQSLDVDALRREILGQTQDLIKAERAEAEKRLAEQKVLADAEIERLKAALAGKVSLPTPEVVKQPTLEELAAEVQKMRSEKPTPPPAFDMEAVQREARESALKEMRLEMFRMQRQEAIAAAKLPPALAKAVQGKTMEEVSASIAELTSALDAVAVTAAEKRAVELKALMPVEMQPLHTASPLKAIARDKGSLAHVLKAEADALADQKAKLFKKNSW